MVTATFEKAIVQGSVCDLKLILKEGRDGKKHKRDNQRTEMNASLLP